MKKEKIEQIIGKKYNRLTVIAFDKSIKFLSGKIHRYFLCKCSCGNKNIISVSIFNLRQNSVKSCGCILKEFPPNLIHGFTSKNKINRFYTIWANMKSRSGKLKYYKKIKICNKWKKFKNFKKDMYKNYLIHSKKYGEKNTTIDRINNNKGYFKKNCRWATRKIQANNRKLNWISSNSIEFRGKKLTIQKWADKLGLKHEGLSSRLYSRKWSLEKALTTPKQ